MAENLKTKTEETAKVEEGDIHKHSRKEETTQTMSVLFCQLGKQAQALTIDKGTTLGQLLKDQKVKDQLEVRVNKADMPRETILEDGQIIVVVPDQIVGGATDK